MPTVETTAKCILQQTALRPTLAIILGSSFGGLQDAVKCACEIPYRAIPGFLPSTVDGHSGKLVVGEMHGVPILALCGRTHFYEGHSLAEITFPVRVLAQCGIEILVLTNAAGGINRRFRPGDFMSFTDHLNFIGDNPLRGWADPNQSRFLDLSSTYDPQLSALMRKAARRSHVRLHAGVYAAVCGPCYETPAEIRAFARLGADAIGMSTVPEVIVAKQCGLRVTALSCITNRAAGLALAPISHAEVLATGDRVKGQATELLREFVRLQARAASK
jgi:purine-nucleoside phosphorylase